MGFLGRRAGLTCLCALALHGRTACAWDGQIVSLRLENDATVSSDRHYTQGGLLSYLSADDAVPGWVKVVSDNLPTFGYKVGGAKWGIGVGQEIYTPEDLLSPVLQTNDRPYA